MPRYKHIVLLFLPIASLAQQRILVATTFLNSKEIKEKYYVLKKNQTIKDGPYVAYYSEKDIKPFFPGPVNTNDSMRIMETGFYKSGIKDGIWIKYSTGHEVIAKEVYRNGRKAGIWQKLIENGRVLENYDYDKNKQLPYDLYNMNFPVVYPEKERENGTSGIVKVFYRIDTIGRVKEFKILKGVSAGCDSEVVRQTRAMLDMFRQYHLKYNTPLPTRLADTVTINFKMQ